MVAGVAPAARTSASTSAAVAAFSGQGMPWVMMVDSSATTGRPAASASRTSGAMSRRLAAAFMRPSYARGAPRGRRRRIRVGAARRLTVAAAAARPQGSASRGVSPRAIRHSTAATRLSPAPVTSATEAAGPEGGGGRRRPPAPRLPLRR